MKKMIFTIKKMNKYNTWDLKLIWPLYVVKDGVVTPLVACIDKTNGNKYLLHGSRGSKNNHAEFLRSLSFISLGDVEKTDNGVRINEYNFTLNSDLACSDDELLDTITGTLRYMESISMTAVNELFS